jgi:predicted RNA-binding protein associated with RNAse of E/G family
VASTADPAVRIHYHRLPDRLDVFTQRLVHRAPDVVVTLLEQTPMPRPLRVGGRTVLEDGAPVVWFTFPGAWHDIGRFHTPDGRFTGCYANILTPVRFLAPNEWETTDLFLDVFLDPGRTAFLLDDDELEAGRRVGAIDAHLAVAARREADRLIQLARMGHWPPPVVQAWTLERARASTSGSASRADR